MVFFSFSVSIGVHPLVPLFLLRPFDYSQKKLSRSKLLTLNFLNFCLDFVCKSFKTEKLSEDEAGFLFQYEPWDA